MTIINFVEKKKDKLVDPILKIGKENHSILFKAFKITLNEGGSNFHYHQPFFKALVTAYEIFLNQFDEKCWHPSIVSLVEVVEVPGQQPDELFSVNFKTYNNLPTVLENKDPFKEEDCLFELTTEIKEMEIKTTFDREAMQETFKLLFFTQVNKKTAIFFKQLTLIQLIVESLKDHFELIELKLEESLRFSFYNPKTSLLVKGHYSLKSLNGNEKYLTWVN